MVKISRLNKGKKGAVQAIYEFLMIIVGLVLAALVIYGIVYMFLGEKVNPFWKSLPKNLSYEEREGEFEIFRYKLDSREVEIYDGLNWNGFPKDESTTMNKAILINGKMIEKEDIRRAIEEVYFETNGRERKIELDFGQINYIFISDMSPYVKSGKDEFYGAFLFNVNMRDISRPPISYLMNHDEKIYKEEDGTMSFRNLMIITKFDNKLEIEGEVEKTDNSQINNFIDFLEGKATKNNLLTRFLPTKGAPGILSCYEKDIESKYYYFPERINLGEGYYLNRKAVECFSSPSGSIYSPASPSSATLKVTFSPTKDGKLIENIDAEIDFRYSEGYFEAFRITIKNKQGLFGKSYVLEEFRNELPLKRDLVTFISDWKDSVLVMKKAVVPYSVKMEDGKFDSAPPLEICIKRYPLDKTLPARDLVINLEEAGEPCIDYE
jgi:hypothetical protein